MYDDTITAIATPPGEGGIGIVRLSGREALSIVRRIFRPYKPGPFRSHHVRYGHIVDPADGSVVDEALAVLMRAPNSFTREDVVELSCHGGPLQRTLSLTLAAGARLAQPGEFTLRAFLNGRIDLTQAEATLDIIRAQTNKGLSLAQAQLGGWLAQEVRRIRADLLEALAYVTVVVDFPEDEVETQDITPTLQAGLRVVSGRGIQTDTFPTSTFEVTGPVALPAAFGSEDVDVTLPGRLTLHGVTRDVEMAAQARLQDDGTVVVAGSLPILFADYEIEPPSIGGFVAVEDRGTLEFRVVLARS